MADNLPLWDHLPANAFWSASTCNDGNKKLLGFHRTTCPECGLYWGCVQPPVTTAHLDSISSTRGNNTVLAL